jgi:hypothetical protein
MVADEGKPPMNVAKTSRWILTALALALPACSSDNYATATNPNIAPTNYKKEIVDALRNVFVTNDTASVSSAGISDPVLRPGDSRYTACVRYTAHGVVPGQIGNAERIAYFHGGRLNQLIPANEGQCDKVAYKPFPELDRLCLGKACGDQDKKSGFGLGNLFGR